MSDTGPYTACGTSKEESPPLYGIRGPGQGIGYHAWYLYPENTFTTYEDAEKAARLMNLAFAEGEKARAAKIKALIG